MESRLMSKRHLVFATTDDGKRCGGDHELLEASVCAGRMGSGDGELSSRRSCSFYPASEPQVLRLRAGSAASLRMTHIFL